MTKALIIGVTGQDGAILAALLLNLGKEVINSANFYTQKIIFGIIFISIIALILNFFTYMPYTLLRI